MVRRGIARRGWRGPRKKAPATGPLRGMWALLPQFLEHVEARNFSPHTLKMWNAHVRRFLVWCDERSLSDPVEVTQPIIERYQRWLFYYRCANGRPLTFQTQHYMLRSVKAFFRWMTRQHLTLFNPAAEIELPRVPKRLPRDVLTAAEVEAVIGQPDIHTPLGIRDRAILETFYSTGIRRQELGNLRLYDLDRARGTVLVRQGKGLKDRVVPIGHRALAWIDKYVTDVRPNLVLEPDEGSLFLTVDGTPFQRGGNLTEITKKYLKAAQITKAGSCHLFRHAMATLMLENGADIRFISEILGHGDLATTQIYTSVSIVQLRKVHQATHPAERAAPGSEPDSAPDREVLDELLADDARSDDEA